MLRPRTEHGQGMPEYVGIAIVGAILVGAVVTTVSDAPVGETVDSAVCKITSLAGGGGDCAAPENTGEGEDGGAFDEPADQVADEPAVPVDRGPACVPVGDQSASDGVPGGSLTLSTPGQQGPVQTQSSVTLSTGSPTVDDRGYEWQDVSVQVKHQASVNAATGPGDLPKDLSASISLYDGTSSEYKVTVPPSMVEDVSAGEVPNPLNPLAMAPGVGVTMSNEFYTGQSVEATYRKIKAGFSYESGMKISTAVQKLSNGDVRVLTGPSTVIRQAMSLGIGTENLSAALVASREFEDYRLEQVDFDLDTTEGRNAYYRMVMQGEVPDSGTDGVADRSTLKGVKGGAKNGFELKVGSLTAGLDLNSSDFDVALETHADGSQTFNVVSRLNDHTRVITQEYDAQGDRTSSSQKLMLRNVDPSVVDGFNQAYGQVPYGESRPEGPQNMVISFDDEDVEQWRQEALEITAYRVGQLPGLVDSEFGGEPPTAEDIEDWVKSHPIDELYQLRGIGGPISPMQMGVLEGIKYPDNVENNVFIAMTNNRHANTLAHNLAMWQIAVADARGVNPTEVSEGAGSTLCRGTA